MPTSPDAPNTGEGGKDSPDARAAESMLPLVYEELRRLADSYFRQQAPSHTLQPTALVHEAYLKLAAQAPGAWNDRAHFIAIAASAMRQILVDHARSRGAAKRGGGGRRITLDESLTPSPEQDLDLLALDDALGRLAEIDERKAKMIELRFFGGLTIDETADLLGVSSVTITKDWRMAKAWISRELAVDDES